MAYFMIISGLIRRHVISHRPVPISLPLNGSFPIIRTAKVMIQMNTGCPESVRRKKHQDLLPQTISHFSRHKNKK